MPPPTNKMERLINTQFFRKFHLYLSPLQWWLMTFALYALSQVTLHWLDSWYAASQFPVPFFEGQTTFNAEQYKSFLAVLQDKGTLGTFFTTQIIDYAYLTTIALSFGALSIAIFRSLPSIPWLKTVAKVLGIISVQAATFDALENAVSFIFLANPQDFADWLIYPYSSFAVAKFACYVVTYFWAPIAVIIILGHRIYRYVKPTLPAEQQSSTPA